MWARIKRIFRSIIGFFIELGESPEMILKQNIRDMQDQIPTMNENLAMMKAQVTLTEKTLRGLQQKEADLTAKIKAALKVQRREIALNFATTLEEVRKELVVEKRHNNLAEKAFDQAKKVKSTFLRTIESKIDTAKKALSNKRQAEWQEKVADAMESFQVAGVDATHDEMIEKMDQESAVAQSKLEIALDSVNAVAFDIEEEAQSMQANETLRQFEIDMGLSPEISAPPEAPQEETSSQEQLLKELS
jgi:phage shock protein A